MDDIIDKYGKLVYSIAKYFDGYKSKEDLYQVGFIGLITAYNKFDSSYGVKFSTYAYSYILGEMKKLVREDKGIKVSRDITKLNLKIEKARILLSQKLYREPSIKELSSFLEIDENLITEAMSLSMPISIDEPVTEDNISLHEVISDKVVDIDTLIALKQELNSLNKEEKTLIEKRYLEDMTQGEVANILGMSQVQVSRYEQKIKTKLKNNLVA